MNTKISPKQFGDVLLKESLVKQFADGLGVFANRNFKKGEVVVKWSLKHLTEKEYQNLPAYERTNFCHTRNGTIHYYSEPERHVNRSKNPNVFPDFKQEADIALRDIKLGEELTILDSTQEDFE